MSKLDQGKMFINNKPLSISTELNIDWAAFNKAKDEAMLEAAMDCAKKLEYEHKLRFVHTYIQPKNIFSNKRKRMFTSIGRRFGKTGLVYHKMVEQLPISDEEKKILHKRYENALRGEE